MAATFDLLSGALVPTVFGLLVVIPAFWSYKHFSKKMEGFDLEMECGAVGVVNHLAVKLGESP